MLSDLDEQVRASGGVIELPIALRDAFQTRDRLRPDVALPRGQRREGSSQACWLGNARARRRQ